MQFIQNLSRNCCLSDLKSPHKVFTQHPQNIPFQTKNLHKVISKKSLKDFSTLKTIQQNKNSNQVSQSRKTRDKSISTVKSIIEKIYEEDRKIIFNSQKVLFRSPQKIVYPQIKHSFTSQNKHNMLNRVKSQQKLTFKIDQKPINPFQQILSNQNREEKYQIKLNSMKTSDLTSFKQQNPEQIKSLFVSFMKKNDDDEDLRSTMEPFLHVQKKKFGLGPKSIVSVNDQQDESVNQSIILQKHSSSKRLMKLI